MLRPPSLQHEYDEYYSRDPAFAPPDRRPPADAGPDEEAAHAQALTDFADRVRIARERGDAALWAELATAGTPTKFTFRHIDGTVFSLIQDDLVDDTIGRFELPILLFRLAIVKATNLGDGAPKVKQVKHPRYGAIADEALVNYILRFDEGKAVIAELGGLVLDRSIGPSPK